MKRIVSASICTFLILYGLQAACVGRERNGVEKEFEIDVPDQSVQAPPFVLRDMQNGSFDLEEHRRKVVLINFWATWCVLCVHELPSFQRLKERIADDQFEIVAVNVQDTIDRVQRYLADKSYTLPFARDPQGKISRTYGVRALPTTFIVDAQGRLVGRVIGDRKWDDPKLVEYLKRLLDAK